MKYKSQDKRKQRLSLQDFLYLSKDLKEVRESAKQI